MYKDVNLSVCGQQAFNHAKDGASVGHVGCGCMGTQAFALQFLGACIGTFGVEVVDDHRSALACQCFSHAQTHAASGAADQRHFSIQSEHILLLPQVCESCTACLGQKQNAYCKWTGQGATHVCSRVQTGFTSKRSLLSCTRQGRSHLVFLVLGIGRP